MKTEKNEVISFRISSRYKGYLDLLVKRSGMGITQYFTDTILNDFRRYIKDMAYFTAVEKVAIEFNVPAHHVSHLLNPSGNAYIETPAWDQETLEKAKIRFDEVYKEAMINFHKEHEFKDRVLEVMGEVFDKDITPDMEKAYENIPNAMYPPK
jgi:hypothetical protein